MITMRLFLSEDVAPHLWYWQIYYQDKAIYASDAGYATRHDAARDLALAILKYLTV